MFSSPLGPTINRYVALKQALGRKFEGERYILADLDAFLSDARGDFDAESFARWCRTREHTTSGVRRNWMRVARNLSLYRRRSEPDCFVPDASQFPPLHQPVRPHIFTEEEFVRLLNEAAKLKPGWQAPLRRETFKLALILLYTTGMRRGELLRLTIGEYDAKEHTLLIRGTKFNKSRLIPLSRDGWVELEAYLRLRRGRGTPSDPMDPLFWNEACGGHAYTGMGLYTTIRALFRSAGIHTVAGNLPRVHDFRHAFAVQALLRWYRIGNDVQTKLPMLSIYMGHVSIVSTEYYLHFIDAVSQAASARFERRYGALLAPLHPEENFPASPVAT